MRGRLPVLSPTQVLLRTEYKDYQDNIELSDLTHLPNPPEKNYKVRRQRVPYLLL